MLDSERDITMANAAIDISLVYAGKPPSAIPSSNPEAIIRG